MRPQSEIERCADAWYDAHHNPVDQSLDGFDPLSSDSVRRGETTAALEAAILADRAARKAKKGDAR